MQDIVSFLEREYGITRPNTPGEMAIGRMWYQNAAASAVVSNVAILTLFDKFKTYGANEHPWKAGDLLRVRAQFHHILHNLTDQVTLIVLTLPGAQTVQPVSGVQLLDDSLIEVQVDMLIESVAAGAASTVNIAAHWEYVDSTSTRVSGSSATRDTAANLDAAGGVSGAVLWAAAHADNQIRLNQLNVELFRVSQR